MKTILVFHLYYIWINTNINYLRSGVTVMVSMMDTTFLMYIATMENGGNLMMKINSVSMNNHFNGPKTSVSILYSVKMDALNLKVYKIAKL
jgi:hypothetical protein